MSIRPTTLRDVAPFSRLGEKVGGEASDEVKRDNKCCGVPRRRKQERGPPHNEPAPIMRTSYESHVTYN
jgi:hypothetical protein